jgi:hypothetical protein
MNQRVDFILAQIVDINGEKVKHLSYPLSHFYCFNLFVILFNLIKNRQCYKLIMHLS